MVRSARRYDFYLPLTDNVGRPIPRGNFADVEKALLARFGGLTAQKREFPFKGIWQGQSRLFIDEVIIMTVLDFSRRGSPSFIAELKQSLLRAFAQLEILVTETALRVH